MMAAGGSRLQCGAMPESILSRNRPGERSI